MKFTLEIDCDNAAFEERLAGEIERILSGVRVAESNLPFSRGRLYDINGNRVGSWALEERL